MCITSDRIGDLARHTTIPSLQGSVSVSTAIEIMDIYDVDIIGVECENEYAGVFSKGDLNKNVLRQNLNPSQTTLYEAMPLNTPFVTADMSVKEAYETMLAYQWDYMPVLDNRTLCGIVSLCNLSKDVMKSFENALDEKEMILNYIQGGESYAIAKYKN